MGGVHGYLGADHRLPEPWFRAATEASDINDQVNRNLFGMMMVQAIICLTYFWGMRKFIILHPGIPILILFLTAATVVSASRAP